MSPRDLHVGMYGAVMGLAGLGMSARAAAPVLPGTVRAPAYFTEPWVAAGAIALAILVPLYLWKLVRHPAAVREDFTNPLLLGFCGAFPVGMSIVAGGLAPYVPQFAGALWWIAFVLLLAFQVWALTRWFGGGIDPAHMNAGWLIIMVGGIVMPGSGIALGNVEASRFIFGVSAAAAPILMALLFYRAIVGPALPAPLRPSWFILLVPPCLIYANGIVLYPAAAFLEILFYFALVLAAALLVLSRGLLGWSFGPPWWAFTFPLDALAYASARYALDHPGPLWQGICAATLLLATLFVSVVLLRTLAAILRSAASRRA